MVDGVQRLPTQFERQIAIRNKWNSQKPKSALLKQNWARKEKKCCLSRHNRELKNHDEVHDDDVCWLGKDWNENVSRKLKMQLVGRSTMTTLNVNTNVKLWCSFAAKFLAMASFKRMRDLIFKPYIYFHWRWKIFSVVWRFRVEKHLLWLSAQRLFNFQPEWDDRVRVSVKI